MDCLVGSYLRAIPSKIKILFAGMQMLDNRPPTSPARTLVDYCKYQNKIKLDVFLEELR
jgi:hypothetical protein